MKETAHPPAPTPEEVAAAKFREQYLQNVNQGLVMAVRGLKASLLLATSASEVVPDAAKLLYNEFLGMANMVAPRENGQ